MRWKGFDGYHSSGRIRTGNYEGGLLPEQLAFIANYLSRVPAEEWVVLAMHIPLVGNQQHQVPQTAELLHLLSERPRTLSLSGHTHWQRHWFLGPNGLEADRGEAVHHHFNVGTASGSWYRGALDPWGLPAATMGDGTPPGTSVLRLGNEGYSIAYRAAGFPASLQMHLHAPKPAPGEEFWVNVYNGHAHSDVRWRLGEDSEWSAMGHVIGPDPHFVEQREREAAHPHGGRRLPEPAMCMHLWSATLPEELAAGVHGIEVHARDPRYGLDVRAWHLVRVPSR